MKATTRPGWLLRRLMSPQGLALYKLLQDRRGDWTIEPKRRAFTTAWELSYQGAHWLTFYAGDYNSITTAGADNALNFWDKRALMPVARQEATRYLKIQNAGLVAEIVEAAK